ncbi:hypothetical protein Y1Q_0022831 [Alligator mississippiensis]|uniref:Uncharacterized protein n=1 Tax=Alligator mississippiensis TaxID=8496 RepID=A0A151N593_ALLMI|nr:hypothetical protein Y1Q_0022831 [Alligator mississippiensis]
MSDCHVTRVYSAGEALSRFGTHSDHHSSALPGCRFRSLAPGTFEFSPQYPVVAAELYREALLSNHSFHVHVAV